MRELFKIGAKLQFFELSWCFLRLEGGKCGQERCKGKCSNVLGTNWRNCLLKGLENGHFSTFSSIFPLVPPTHL